MQKAWQAWTFVDLGLRLRGLAPFGRKVFCPWRPLEVRKQWHARTFAAAELAASMTLKSL